MIQPASTRGGGALTGSAFTSVAVAVGHALAHAGRAIANLARTGGGGIGRLIAGGGLPVSLLLLGLALLALGLVGRRVAYA